jgi:hypothetical protein
LALNKEIGLTTRATCRVLERFAGLQDITPARKKRISDGDRHNHDDLPILLAGKGAGTLKPGRHMEYSPQPLNNLCLSLLDRLGVPADSLGDSMARPPKLDG